MTDSNMQREIAIAIGHHFWHCSSDAAAAVSGNDCAVEVMQRLEACDRQEAFAIEDQDAYEDAVEWRMRQADAAIQKATAEETT